MRFWRPILAIVCGAICLSKADLVIAKGKGKDWITLENCQLIPNKANDGDSFHISSNNIEYLLRLYFVDAPETASVGPARLIEQAEYFGVSVPQVIEIGEDAKKFVDKKLADPFTVVTRLAEGLGRSKIQRVYGFVRTKDGDLGEQLVANGLARIHGVHPAMPDGSSGQDEIQKLEQLEQTAKQKRLGGWAINPAPGSSSALANQPNRAPVVVQSPPKPAAPSIPMLQTTPRPAVTVAAAPPTVSQPAKLDVNMASKSQLENVPGIGPVIADRISAARPFKSADDLRSVKGIGDKKYEKIRPYFQ
jgi:DNA uptake protein ComE-like DNA-binding protein